MTGAWKALSKAIMLLLVVCFRNFVSDKNSRPFLENSGAFFKNVQNFTIFPEKFQNNSRNSRMNGHNVLLKTNEEILTYESDQPR